MACEFDAIALGTAQLKAGPIAASPLLNFALAFAALARAWAMSAGISGYGAAVRKRIVYGSTTVISLICLV
jgi:hypothetical protein